MHMTHDQLLATEFENCPDILKVDCKNVMGPGLQNVLEFDQSSAFLILTLDSFVRILSVK